MERTLHQRALDLREDSLDFIYKVLSKLEAGQFISFLPFYNYPKAALSEKMCMYTDFDKIEWAVIAMFPDSQEVLCIDPEEAHKHIQMEYELLSELDLAYITKLLADGDYYIVTRASKD